MKFENVLDMLFTLLKKRKVTAGYFAKKYGVSLRTVYRYVAALQPFVPLTISRGRNGGICLPDHFKLPLNFMTNDEDLAAIDALEIAYCHQPEERFITAKEKLSQEYKPEYDEEELEEAEDEDDIISAVEKE